MYNLIKADLFKLRKSTPIKILFLIMWICAALVTFVFYLVSKGSVGAEVSNPSSLLADVVMLSIVGPAIAGIFICGDFENKTIDNAVSCGRGRGTIMVSKTLAYFFVMVLMYLPYLIITAFAYCSGFEFTKPFVASVLLDILGSKQGASLTATGFLKMLGIMATMLVVYEAQLSICVFLAFLFKNKPVLVAGIGIFFLMLSAQAILLSKGTSIIGRIISYTPFAMGYGIITMDASPLTLIKAIIISLIFIIVVLAATYGIFKKAELK